MRWRITIEAKTRWSVVREYEQQLAPTRDQIIQDLHRAFPGMRKALRDELIGRVLSRQFVAVQEPAFARAEQ